MTSTRIGVKILIQTDLDDLAEGHARLQRRGQFRIHLGVALVPENQSIVGVIEGHAVRHGVEGFTEALQRAGLRRPGRPGEGGRDAGDSEGHGDDHHGHHAAGDGQAGVDVGARHDDHPAHGREMQEGHAERAAQGCAEAAGQAGSVDDPAADQGHEKAAADGERGRSGMPADLAGQAQARDAEEMHARHAAQDDETAHDPVEAGRARHDSDGGQAETSQGKGERADGRPNGVADLLAGLVAVKGDEMGREHRDARDEGGQNNRVSPAHAGLLPGRGQQVQG